MRKAVRGIRIAGIATAFFVVFQLSQAVTRARQGVTVPGLSAAIGVLSLMFLVSALVTERTKGESDTRKDLLWGLTAGGFAIVISRF